MSVVLINPKTKIMKSNPLLICLICLFCLLNYSCNTDDDLNVESIMDPIFDPEIDPITDPSTLEVVSDGKSCDQDFFLICETITVEDPVLLLESDFDYLIWPDKRVGDEIIYRNAQGEEFSIEITKQDHYLYEQRQYASCSLSIEHVSYICQQNEKIDIEFRTDFFDNKLNRFELYRVLPSVADQVLGDQVSMFTFGQERGVDNIFEYYHRIFIDTERSSLYYDFHDSIMLGGEEYKDVWDFGIFNTLVSLSPIGRLYYSRQEGIIGFEQDGKIWFEVE